MSFGRLIDNIVGNDMKIFMKKEHDRRLLSENHERIEFEKTIS